MQEMATFIATLLHSATNAHFMHFSTDSFAKHMALGEFYDEIVDLTDDLAEQYMGKYGKITEFPNTYHAAKDPIQYLQNLGKFVEEARKDLPQDSWIQNEVDGIAELISQTTYKLVNLK